MENSKNEDKTHEKSLENKNNMFLILKENKNFDKSLFDDIIKMIEDSKFNYEEKNELKTIFSYENEKDINIEKLINSNNNLLNLIKRINETEFDKIKNIIKENENKYIINSNFIIKYLFKCNNENLTKIEKIVVDYLYKFNELCQKIMEKYIHYLVFNSKINNIYNYNNQFLLFMGENFSVIIFSLITKKFLSLETANLIEGKKNCNNFEIINIFSDKILINNKEDKIIYVIENNDFYNFSLVKTFKYHYNAQTNKNYLLIDDIKNNDLQFSLINLDNYNSDNDRSKEFNRILNLKLENNPPKFCFNKDFLKFGYLYEDFNQLEIIDCTIYKKFDQNNENQNNPNLNIILIKDNDVEIVPKIFGYSSFYDDNNDYEPEKILDEKNYYCSKTNKDEYIVFQFNKEYHFCLISITYPDSYKNARLQKLRVVVYDNQKNYVEGLTYTLDRESGEKVVKLNIDAKGAYLKFEFLSNLGADYFCISRIQFFADITHSINIK